ncbi:MAG: RagB/SusD family nutrient uptake outer membrane protein [Breznakibacter sp.]
MNRKILTIGILGLAMTLVASCTDLDETLYDKVKSDDYGKTPSEVETIVGGAYSSLRGVSEDGVHAYAPSEFVFFLNETVSDEACIPTRGENWKDGGRYQEAQRHTWTAGNLLFQSAWKYAYQGINRINGIIYQVSLTNLSDESKEKIFAELRGLRAYYYYLLLDWFGNVPLVTRFGAAESPANSTRAQVYEFVESELLDVMDLLPSEIVYGRFTQNVGHMLLARLYINSEVFIGTARWQDCISECEKVAGYHLEGNYFTNFLTENQVSGENIFVIPYDHKAGTIGNYMNSMSLHYNQRQAFSGPWQWSGNGMCAQPGVYSKFDDNDIRKKSMLAGPQYVYGTTNVILMSNGDELNYTESIENFVDAKENEGVRLYKYEVKADEEWERDHDLVVMRYAEVLMMQAECYVRLGYPETARPFVEQIRIRAGLDTPSTIDLDFLDEEYLKEFIFEGTRRTVNIRFGTYFEPWWEKGATPAYRGIFPIPQAELDKNPNLHQNFGY